MSTNNNYLVCKRVKFYAPLDEDIFFDWITKIPCIAKFETARDELYLDLVDTPLSYDDMKDLIALLYRYKISMHQLGRFINEQNKAAAEPWMKKINSKKHV